MKEEIKIICKHLFAFFLLIFCVYCLLIDGYVSTKSVASGVPPLQIQELPIAKKCNYGLIKVQERNNDYWKLRKTRVIVFFGYEKYEKEFDNIEEPLQMMGDKGYELINSTFSTSINNWYIYHTLYFMKK